MLEKIFVTVPFYNEEKLIGTLIDSFKQQTDQFFHVIYVDNNSTDNSVDIIHNEQTNSAFTYEIIEEKEKGTGCASDSGFRYAISKHKAEYLARTDADCLVDSNWIQGIRKNLISKKLDFVGGIIKIRNDDVPLSYFQIILTPVILFLADLYAPFKFGFKGYKYIFFIVAGNNLAINANTYLKSGGFPRSSIHTVDEDTVLVQRVRKITSKAKRCRNMIVYQSGRRLRAYGYRNIILWYHDRKYKPEIVDIR